MQECLIRPRSVPKSQLFFDPLHQPYKSLDPSGSHLNFGMVAYQVTSISLRHERKKESMPSTAESAKGRCGMKLGNWLNGKRYRRQAFIKLAWKHMALHTGAKSCDRANTVESKVTLMPKAAVEHSGNHSNKALMQVPLLRLLIPSKMA
eukprot:1159519-Pelagomonas_calceolata.AAC.4